MNILRQIMKWFWKAWPLWAMLIIGWIHYEFYNRFNYNGEYINRIASSTLQIVGGIIVLYSVNENMGMFKRGNLFSLLGQWFKSFPLIRKSVTVHVEGCGGIIFGGEAAVTTKRKFNTLEEQLDEIERQIGECRQLISDREKVVMERIKVSIESGSNLNLLHFAKEYSVSGRAFFSLFGFFSLSGLSNLILRIGRKSSRDDWN